MKKFFQNEKNLMQKKDKSLIDLLINKGIQPLNIPEMKSLKGGEGGDQGQDDSDIDLND